MPMPDAWNANLPNEVLYDAAVFDYDSGSGTRVVVGMTDGPPTFIEGREDRVITVDGVANLDAVIGLDRVSRWVRTRFEGVLKQLPLSTFAKFSPGSTSVAAGSAPVVTTYTPAASGHVFTLAEHYLKPRLNWQIGATGWAYIEFPYGKIENFPQISSPNREEGTLPFTLLAKLDPAAVGFTTKIAPWKLVTSI